MSVKKSMAWGVAGLSGLAVSAVGGLTVRYHLGRRKADRIWLESRYPLLEGLGSWAKGAIDSRKKES